MAETQPRGEQLRFLSSKTGTHNLDTYLESAERGSKSIGDMLGDIFDSSGVFDATNFEFQFDPSDNQLEVRVGGSSNSYVNITSFFNIRGAYSSSSTTYKNFDLVTRSNGDVHIVHGLASNTATTTFADDAAVNSSSNTTKLVDVSGAATQAAAAASSATAAANSATAAATSASAASTSESNASSSASTASGHKDTATTKASEASTSASNAATSASTASTQATNAANSATAAATSLSTFQGQYHGASSSDPTTNLDSGDLYFNTSSGLKVYNGSAWEDIKPTSSEQTAINNVNSNSANINTVAGQNSNITTLAGISSDITAVAGISADVAAVENKLTEIQAVADDLAEASSEIDLVAGSIANVNTVGGAITNVNTVGGAITNVNTVASNISGVNSFADRYRIASSAPSSSLDQGDLYFDTTANELKVYKSSGWAAAGSTVNGTSARFQYTISGTPTTVTGSDTNGNTLAYDAGFIDVYLNGVKQLNGTDVTVTSGTSVVFASALANADIVDIVAYGTFSLASFAATAITSGTLNNARLSSDVTQNTATQTLTNKTINASNNTLSNIPNSALANNSITINGTAVNLGASTTLADNSVVMAIALG
jgi:hypothetical protein